MDSELMHLYIHFVISTMRICCIITHKRLLYKKDLKGDTYLLYIVSSMWLIPASDKWLIL